MVGKYPHSHRPDDSRSLPSHIRLRLLTSAEPLFRVYRHFFQRQRSTHRNHKVKRPTSQMTPASFRVHRHGYFLPTSLL